MYTTLCQTCGREKKVKEKRSINLSKMCRSCAAKLSVKQRYSNGNADGRASLPQYYTWKDMHRRVKTAKTYKKNKIKVCEEWDNFTVFNEWALLNGYQKGLHLDRINALGGYNPNNCRFISPYENTSRVQVITKLDIELILKLSKEGKSVKEIYKVFYDY